MNRHHPRLIVLLLLVVSAGCALASSAFADDGTSAPETDSEADASARAPHDAPFAPSVAFHGFVDGAVTTQVYVGEDQLDNEPVVFGLNDAELDVIAQPTERLTLRMDLQFGPANFNGSAEGTGQDATVEILANIVEQAYVDYHRSPDGEGFFLKFGHYNAPIGAESVDRPDMLQYSHGLLFDLATPTNVTGFGGGYNNDRVTAQLFIMNDWEEYYSPGDLAFGARVDASFNAGSIGAVIMVNDVVNAEDSGEFTFDVDASFTTGIATLIVEYYLGYLIADIEGIENRVATGVLLKAHFIFNEVFELTARGEYLQRYDDALNLPNVSLPRSGAYHGFEATLAGIFNLSDNLYTTLELRLDKAFTTSGSEPMQSPAVVQTVTLNPTTDHVVLTPTIELTAQF